MLAKLRRQRKTKPGELLLLIESPFSNHGRLVWIVTGDEPVDELPRYTDLWRNGR